MKWACLRKTSMVFIDEMGMFKKNLHDLQR
jgi:hypothetical protein